MKADKGYSGGGARNGRRTRRPLAHQARTFDQLMTNLCGAFVRATVDEIDGEINAWLKRIVLALGLDRATVAEIGPSGWWSFSHGWARQKDQIISQSLDANVLLPWLLRKMAAGETVVIPRLDDLPEDAAVDRDSFSRYGTKSNVTIPIRAGGELVGGVGFATLYHERKWPPRIVEQLRLLAEILGYALERKRSVGEIRRLREELTHLSRTTTFAELAASMTHELDQPLMAIMSNADAAELLLAAGKPNLSEVRAALRDIAEDDRRAADIISRFRSMFKRRELRRSTIRPKDLLEGIERILKGSATIKKVSLTFRCAPSLSAISADPILLQQALVNLILNAFDSVCAAAGPREVEVSAFQQKSGSTNFTVRDTGTGIEPHFMPRLFESFFSTKPDGLGMGLAIARSIVETHGGHLWVSQTDEHGSTFEFSLPTRALP